MFKCSYKKDMWINTCLLHYHFHVCYITISVFATLPLPCLLHYLFHVMEEALFDLGTVTAPTTRISYF